MGLQDFARQILVAFAMTALVAATTVRPATSHFSQPLHSIQKIYEFPNNTYVENLAVRANGQILINPLTMPQLWLVDPHFPGEGFVVHTFSGILGLSGIVEYKPDVFAVLAGNFSFETGDPGFGTWGIWSVDLAGINVTSNASTIEQPLEISKVADIPEATFLNGLSVLYGDEKQYLIAGDVKTGEMYSIDVETGEYAVIINNTYTSPQALYGFGPSATDGIKVREDGVLFFSNIGQGMLVSVSLNKTDGHPNGDFDTVATTLTPGDQWDDFALDCDGNVWMSAGGANTVQKISPKGRVEIAAGGLNSTAIAEPTSAEFGRREDDADVLYVTTAGGMVTPVDGSITFGGQVIAIRTGNRGSCCSC